MFHYYGSSVSRFESVTCRVTVLSHTDMIVVPQSRRLMILNCACFSCWPCCLIPLYLFQLLAVLSDPALLVSVAGRAV